VNVLFATDGSDSAARAQALVGSIAWPDRTTIRVLQVVPTSLAHFRHEDPHAHAEANEKRAHAIERQLKFSTRSLQAPRRVIEIAVVIGPPATIIVDEARASFADLLVLGSRGRSAEDGAMFGSIADTMVDRSPCPVLIARAERITGIVLAHDGSAGAQRAEAMLLETPFLRSLPVRVLSTWGVGSTYLATYPDGGGFVGAGLYAEMADDAREYAHAVAEGTTARLEAAGLTAAATVTEAAAAEAIASSAGPNDLIVMGTRGHTGLRSLRIGSVARGVLHRADSSVLFVPAAVGPSRAKAAREDRHLARAG
jgi:nucleotide-binding universal stress UspA family protein